MSAPRNKATADAATRDRAPHTAGPWFHLRDAYTSEGSTRAHLIEDEEGRILALVDYRERPVELNWRGKSDAALIAAAPDLLEALKDALRGLEVLDRGESTVAKQARAAITKATGAP